MLLGNSNKSCHGEFVKDVPRLELGFSRLVTANPIKCFVYPVKFTSSAILMYLFRNLA